MQSSPYIFDEFFASGKEESISPFLTPPSRKLAKNLSLKIAILSGILLLASFILSFFSFDISRLVLIFVYFFAGIPALINTIEDLFQLEINIDVLMTLAAFLSILIGSELEGALLLVLFSFSGALEESVSAKAKGTIQNLGHLSPAMARVIDEEGNAAQRSVKEIQVGSQLLVKAGEIIPLDGRVTQGHSFVNLSHLTGESAPVPKKIDDEVQAGSINLDGSLTVAVTRISGDSTLARIIHLISQAQEAKPKIERLFDRFGKIYSTTIIMLAFLFALILPWLFSLSYLGPEGSIYRALTFLIAASPCALIIATPTAYLSAISSCAKKGILLKGGFTLDALASCKIFAFDKTGTLTTGNLVCTSIETLTKGKQACTNDQALSIAASLERGVLHPMAEAITFYAAEKSAPLIPVENFKAIAGYGIEGEVEINGFATKVYLGHFGYIKEKINPEILKSHPHLDEKIYHSGKLVSLLLVKDALFTFHFLDELRPNISSFIQSLKQNFDVRVVMLTGDHYLSAKDIAKSTMVDEFYADLRPDDKLKLVSKLIKEHGLAMVGDGVNDAPALARSTVGISMGKIGSRTAVEASDIVFLNDELPLLGWLMAKAKSTLHIVRQNLILALGVIVLATTPALLGYIPLWLAVVLHEGGTVLVGLNSLRLLKK